MKERLIFFIKFLLLTSWDILNLLNILMYLLINRIHEHFNINSFKDEESDKMSADSAHIQGASGGESTNSLVASSSYSLTIGTKYVFVFQILLLS